MFLVTQKLVEAYLRGDDASGWLTSHSRPEDESLVCQKWLRQTPAKRFIYSEIYGELLTNCRQLKVLDVGGGLTGLTRELARRHQYVLSDLLAHDDVNTASAMKEQVGSDFIRVQDWITLRPDAYDLVIANDIFPNVDQRLEVFLKTFLPRAKRMRLSLTYYNVPRFYMTRRVDADEILCLLAWNSEYLVSVLKKFSTYIVGSNFDVFTHPEQSAYSNGRQVCLVEFMGGAQATGEA